MRVAMFSRMPSDPDHPKGGVESATVGLVRGLAARDNVEVHIVTLQKDIDEDQVEETPYGTVHRLAAGRLPMIIDVFGGPGRRKIDKYIAGLEPDVVHFQETYGFGGPCLDFPTVFTVHGFDSLNLVTEEKYLWRVRAPLWAIAEKKGIGSHSHIVSIAPYVTEKLEEICDAEITPIPNAISPQFFDLESKPVPGRIFFAGWINRRKNITAAIRALGLLVESGQDATLHAAGAYFPDEYLEEVHALIDELGLKSRVKLLGRVGQDVLRNELQEANVLLLPSLQENAPMAIAEAMAAGIPVVTSNVCGMPTMVAEGESGFLVEPNDIPYIAEKVGLLLSDQALRQKMSAHVRQVAFDTYHPESVISATLALYERIQRDSNS